MEENNTQLESNTNTPKPNTGNSKNILIIILFIIIIGLGVFLAFALANQPKESEKTADAPTTAAITAEDYQKARLLTNLILFQRNSSDQLSVGFTPNFDSLKDIANLSETAKTTIANHYTNEEFPNTWVKMNSEELTALQTALGVDVQADPQTMDFYVVTHDFDITKTAEAYKSIFGSELDLSQAVIRLDYAAPGIDYIYLPSNKTLYTGAGGGDILMAKYTYLSSIETKDNTINVNFSIFESQYPLDDIYYNDSEKCYDDIERSHTVQCNLYLPEGVNSTNYKDLKQYRLVFEKQENGDIVYKTAETL